MNAVITLQKACKTPLPLDKILKNWVNVTLSAFEPSSGLTIRFVDPEEMQHLNHTYRNQNKTTNVLAFPADFPDDIECDYPFLGDLVICPAVLQEESHHLKINLDAHWAHILIHGILHLLGYDHMNERDAQKMQALEIQLLDELGFNNPYE